VVPLWGITGPVTGGVVPEQGSTPRTVLVAAAVTGTRNPHAGHPAGRLAVGVISHAVA